MTGKLTVVQYVDLGMFGSSSQLVDALFGEDEGAAWKRGTHELHLFLDSLDECRLPMGTAARLIAKELGPVDKERLFLRIACRTAAWPQSLETRLEEIFGEESVKVFELTPLRRRDVIHAARLEKIEAERFLDDVSDVGVVALANRPITLRFLIREFKESSRLPRSRMELYKVGCSELCREQNQYRREDGTNGKFSPEQRLVVAARIAALSVFCSKLGVTLPSSIEDRCQQFLDVETIAKGCETADQRKFPVTQDAILEALGTGLFTARGAGRLGWAHKTYQEFLAAYYLACHDVALPQILSLFVHPFDAEGKLIPQLHETASWLASVRTDIRGAILEKDPEVLLYSDVAAFDDDVKRDLVERLLNLVDQESSLLNIHDDRLLKLSHPSLPEQLRPYVTGSAKRERTRRLSIEIAKACLTEELQDLLVKTALDPENPHETRVSAAHAIAQCGTSPYKKILKVLLSSDLNSDTDDELKGAVLLAVWPEHLSVVELLPVLTYPKRDRFFGLYQVFLNRSLVRGISEPNLPSVVRPTLLYIW